MTGASKQVFNLVDRRGPFFFFFSGQEEIYLFSVKVLTKDR